MRKPVLVSSVLLLVCLLSGCPEPPAPLSNNADLASLTVSAGTLTPAFAAGTTAYTVTDAVDAADIIVTGVPADANAGVSANSGQNTVLGAGDNPITITVTAQDGATTKDYTVSVFKNGFDKWVQTDYGAVDSDLTFTTTGNDNVTIVYQSANLMWSRVGFNSLMPVGATYTVSFTLQSNRATDFLSVYENDSTQYYRNMNVVADTPTAVSFNVTPQAGADPHSVISFRAYPNLTTGYVAACTLQITNFSIVVN